MAEVGCFHKTALEGVRTNFSSFSPEKLGTPICRIEFMVALGAEFLEHKGKLMRSLLFVQYLKEKEAVTLC